MTDAERLDLLSSLIAKAKAAGADAADAVLGEGVSLTLARRLDQPEHLERAEGTDLGLRVFMGKRQAIVSSSDLGRRALDELVERAVAMVKVVPEDAFCGLADPDQLARDFPDFDGCDPIEPTPEILTERARIAEEAARAIPGVTNSEGAQAAWGRSTVAFVASNGFARARTSSSHSISASVLAGEGLGMERDYDFTTAVHAADLESPDVVGRRAGERAVKRLKPRKATSAQVPVVYDPRVADSLIRHLASAVMGPAVARGTTFLKDKLGQRVCASGIVIVDDPHRRRGLRSKAYDGEGIPTRKKNVVDDGVLTTWILDLGSARQLGLETTGNASRGTTSPPSPSTTNFYLAAGARSPKDLIADIESGFYVTELIGMGVNGVTGDYSRGASGFWIENGTIAYPVSEITVAGNLKDMFLHMTPADDLEFRHATDAPTVRVDGMTVAGR